MENKTTKSRGNRVARLKQQLATARAEAKAATAENTRLITYLATLGECDNYREWSESHNPTTTTEAVAILSKVINQRDEEAESLIIEMERSC